ncbi:hypothetical protein PQR39_35495 [Paraburkholderia sediminicola]|uniref:DUF7352 domain-containing protein n=1 Tax=Paraburkholderia sediminicola TaxID=458836 RepID=UPI0038BAF37C
MAKVIHKFLLRKRGEVCTIKLPKDAVVTRIGVQDGSPFAWVMVDPDAPYNAAVEFLVVWTGDKIPDGFWPLCTFDADGLVYHGLTRYSAGLVASGVPA